MSGIVVTVAGGPQIGVQVGAVNNQQVVTGSSIVQELALQPASVIYVPTFADDLDGGTF